MKANRRVKLWLIHINQINMLNTTINFVTLVENRNTRIIGIENLKSAKNGAVITKEKLDKLEQQVKESSAEIAVGEVKFVSKLKDGNVTIDFNEVEGTKRFNFAIPASLNPGKSDYLKHRLLFNKVEIDEVPENTIVNYFQDEVRVAVPSNTVWSANKDGKVCMRAIMFAPTDAIYFKNALGKVIPEDASFHGFENYELDFAWVDSKITEANINWFPLDTDYLVCVLNNDNPLTKKEVITLNDLKKERLILRLKSSTTRKIFEASLEAINDSINNYNVVLEVDNIATIKDLIRKDFGISILSKSACMDEVTKKKLTILLIKDLSMERQNYVIYSNFSNNLSIIEQIVKSYQDEYKQLEQN